MFRLDQHAKHPYDIETHSSCDSPCTTLVDQNQTGLEFNREAIGDTALDDQDSVQNMDQQRFVEATGAAFVPIWSANSNSSSKHG